MKKTSNIDQCFNRGKESGFILLMSSIVISVILVATVITISFGGFFTRFNLLDSYNKEASLALADACGEIAVLKLKQDPSYNPTSLPDGKDTITIGSDSCDIISASATEIRTTAEIDRATTNVRIDLNSGTVSRWREE